MKKSLGAIAVVAVLTATAAAAQYAGAQNYTPPPPSTQNQGEQASQRAIESEVAKRRNTAAPSHEQILRDAAALAKASNLSCEIADANLLGQGTAQINGKNLTVKTYETACSNGLGYFLVDQTPEPTIGFSCFAADATHAADIAAKRDPQPACALPANADVKKAAANVLGKLGQQCQVTALKLVGRDTKNNAELTEVACNGGTGFVISSPLPGSVHPASALSCPDSYRRGVACKMSSNGAPIVTLDTFKQVLAQHKVACTAEAVRSVGRQTNSKRHVVEFKCPEQPNGLVALIPLEDSTAPFEVMDCISAGRRAQVICTLNQIH